MCSPFKILHVHARSRQRFQATFYVPINFHWAVVPDVHTLKFNHYTQQIDTINNYMAFFVIGNKTYLCILYGMAEIVKKGN